jgi:predicted transcriptional regulator
MGSASKYWRLVRIDGAGRRREEEVAIAKVFFQKQFTWVGQADLSDGPVQRELMKVWQGGSEGDRDAANRCLRCFISHQIEQVCIKLEFQFGSHHGFTRQELFPFVLDDDGLQASLDNSSQYQSLANEILLTFDPNRASLSTWVVRRVRQHRELNLFLLQHGVYLVTDWVILNETSLDQVQRILAEFYGLTSDEVKRACQLLQSYHAIYRQDRLKQRQAGMLKGKARCLPPTPEQLDRIATYLEQTPSINTQENILNKLQTLATQLRQHRVYVRGGAIPAESLDQPDSETLSAVEQSLEEAETQVEKNQFLTFYREQFLSCLDQAIEQATNVRFTYLQRKAPETAEQFLAAMELFHCRGQAMGKIAAQIGLQAQFQVTRLMKLKEFRATVRQKLLQLLGDRILDKAKTYADPDRLQDLDCQIETALDEQISALIQQAEVEASVAKNHPLTSLFSRRLCHHLDVRKIAS